MENLTSDQSKNHQYSEKAAPRASRYAVLRRTQHHFSVISASNAEPEDNDEKTLLSRKLKWRGLPWWLCGKESACQCRGCGFNPGPHAIEQLSLCATTTEPALQPTLYNKRSHCREKPERCK